MLRDRDLATLARAERQLSELAARRASLRRRLERSMTDPAHNLDWPGQAELWADHLRMKDARLGAAEAEAHAAAQPVRARAAQSFGRALALKRLAEDGADRRG